IRVTLLFGVHKKQKNVSTGLLGRNILSPTNESTYGPNSGPRSKISPTTSAADQSSLKSRLNAASSPFVDILNRAPVCRIAYHSSPSTPNQESSRICDHLKTCPLETHRPTSNSPTGKSSIKQRDIAVLMLTEPLPRIHPRFRYVYR